MLVRGVELLHSETFSGTSNSLSLTASEFIEMLRNYYGTNSKLSIFVFENTEGNYRYPYNYSLFTDDLIDAFDDMTTGYIDIYYRTNKAFRIYCGSSASVALMLDTYYSPGTIKFYIERI